MRDIVLTCGLALGTLPLFMFVKPVNGVTLDLLPPMQNVTVGESVIIDVQVSELGNGTSPSVGAFNLELTYDPTVLTFNDLTFSELLNISDDGIQSIDSSTPGTLIFGNVSLDSDEQLNAAQPDSFSLANVEFIGSGLGTDSPLSLTIIELLDENFNDFDPVTQNDAIVTVSPAATKVPESDLGLTGWGVLLGLSCLLTQKKTIH